MGKFTKMAIFNSYVKLPEGIPMGRDMELNPQKKWYTPIVFFVSPHHCPRTLRHDAVSQVDMVHIGESHS